LADAMLCEDCDTISDRPKYCPACGSSSLLSLARVLNRTEAAQPA
jgi:primosomal protein N'